MKSDSALPPGTAVRLRRSDNNKAFDGLLIVDGVITSSSALSSMSPDRIESVEVVKGDAANRLYNDPRAANGVIVIKTKK